MKKYLFVSALIISLLTSYIASAKDLAVLLYVTDKTEGDKIYENYTKQVGLSRNLHPKGPGNYEYHVTLGYIRDVIREDIGLIKKHLFKSLEGKLANIEFEFGAATLLGMGLPYISAIPLNPEIFQQLNLIVNDSIEQFKHGKYELDKITMPANYIPHLSLNGQVNRNVEINDIAEILLNLNSHMSGVKIKLGHLEIR